MPQKNGKYNTNAYSDSIVHASWLWLSYANNHCRITLEIDLCSPCTLWPHFSA